MALRTQMGERRRAWFFICAIRAICGLVPVVIGGIVVKRRGIEGVRARLNAGRIFAMQKPGGSGNDARLP